MTYINDFFASRFGYITIAFVVGATIGSIGALIVSKCTHKNKRKKG